MADEREITAENVGALFGRPKQADEQPEPEQPAGKESTPTENTIGLDAEREAIARLVLSNPKLAPLVTGDTVREMAASAVEIARLFAEGRAEAERKRPPDFDGGPREPLPLPEPSHEEWLVELLQETRGGRGTGWG